MPQALKPRRAFPAAALLSLGLAAHAPAAAQGADPSARVVYGDGQTAPAILAPPSTGTNSGMVDESALRYYAANKQTARMKAEIVRLKRLYPGWTEPADLDTLKPSPPEEAPLWDLFSAGRFAELRSAITARRAADPTWQPSEELARKLLRADFRNRIRTLAATQPEAAVALYRAAPSALDPGDVESVWTVADALASAGSTEEALALYRSVLESSADAGARRGTIQKAIAHLKMAQVDGLVAMGRGEAEHGQDGSGGAEFDPIRTDITRARIAAFLHDDPATIPSAADLTAFQTYARNANDPSQTGLLGWYAYRQRRFRDALDWFKLAVSNGDDPMIAHGLAHTLRELNRMRDAEDVAYAWRDRFVGNEILFIDLLERPLTQPNPPFIEPARIDRYARVVALSSSGEGAQALGWYAYNSCQFDAALEWFQRAVAWLPGETTVLGYALTLQRLKRQREFLEVVNRYDGLFAKVVNLVFSEETGPPLPCQQQAAETARPQGQAQAQPQQPAADAPAYGRVPRPGTAPADTRPPAVTRKEFPIAVSLDNPLRYPPTSVRPFLAETPPPGTYAKEPAMPPAPLVARRVPGAGPMPYERFGYTLLPAYDGSTKATTMGLPAQGTLWRQQQERAGGRESDPAVAEEGRFAVPGRASALVPDPRRGTP